ncbi:MAG: hypothetical protein ABJ327_01280 [Litoreibacter sp.]
MSGSSLFEDFSADTLVETQKSNNQVAHVPNAEVENRIRSSFDDGYKDGWVDALAAAATEQTQINSDMAVALQEAGFAYFEARLHIFNSMRPLLEAMVEQVLPRIAEQTLVHHIVDKIQEISQISEPPMIILCNPNMEISLRNIVEEQVTFPVEVKAEVTLTESQAMLKFPDGQTKIDLDEAVRELSGAIDDFYKLNTKKEHIDV